MDKLNLTGRKTKILLCTMKQEKMVGSFIVAALEIAELDNNTYCDMADLLVQYKMPVEKSNIPKQRDVNDWPHLKHVNLPETTVHVDLLIGINMPRALDLLEVIRSEGAGPFLRLCLVGQ